MVFQILAVLLLLAAGSYLLHNTLANMRTRGIQSGFDFISQPAGFAIGESIIPFDSAQSYGKAYLVGLVNTLRVALAGIVAATLLGTLIGIGRLSRNLLVRSLCGAYVEVVRNIPLLLQLFIWYFLLTELLPPIESALEPITGLLFFSKNGLQFPLPIWSAGHGATLAGLGVGVLVAVLWWRFTRQRFEATGQALPMFWPGMALVLLCGLVGWFIGGAPSGLDIPERTEVSVVGGGALTPEFLTVLFGLTIYTASYIAEVVRAGIQSVAYGQHEAAAALGLTRGMQLRLVQLPQALRVIIPPLTSQYLNLTKNSSLAVAVGYPDLVSISAMHSIALVMACYLTLSLLTSALMNFYNRRARLKDR